MSTSFSALGEVLRQLVSTKAGAAALQMIPRRRPRGGRPGEPDEPGPGRAVVGLAHMAGLPRLRCVIAVIRAPYDSRTSAVSSVELSSATMSSKGASSFARTLSIAPRREAAGL